MSKKWLSLFVLSFLILTACGNDSTESGEPETNEESEGNNVSQDQETEEVEEEQAEESSGNEIVLGEPMNIGDYVMTIQNYKLGVDHEGNDALIIEYDWVNESDESASPFMTFSLTAFQDGVETDDVFMVEGVDLETGQKEVRPGGKIEGAQTTVGISDKNKPLELEIDELISLDSNPYTAEIDLSTLE